MDAPEQPPQIGVAATEHLTIVGPPPAPDARSMPQIVRAIVADTSTLFRKEVELAKQELGQAVAAKLKAVAAFGAAGVMAVFMVFFFGFAAASALDIVLPIWAAFLIVGGVFLLVLVLAVAFGMHGMKSGPMAPEETKRTVKEDVRWAKAQLKR